MSLTEAPPVQSLRRRGFLFLQHHREHIRKGFRWLFYTARGSMLLYVAVVAFQNQFYFLTIAFAYFALVDYFEKYRLMPEGLS